MVAFSPRFCSNLTTPSPLIGLLLCFGVTLSAHGLAHAPFPPFSLENKSHPVDPLALAIVIGILIRQFFPLCAEYGKTGFCYAVRVLLPLAIVFLGLKLNLHSILTLSTQSLSLSVACVLLTLVITYGLCIWWGVNQKLALLVATGTAICGGTAIAVIAPVIYARDEESAFALSAVTFCGLVCVFIFPPLGYFFQLSQNEFGVWAGISVHATAQVIATTQIYGPQASEVALVVKLTRVLFLAPLLIGFRFLYTPSASLETNPLKQNSTSTVSTFKMWTLITKLFPPFILGFLFCAALNTYQVIPETLQWGTWSLHPLKWGKSCSYFLLLMGMSGVGLQVDFERFKNIGWTPLLAGGGASLVMSTLCLLGIWSFL